MRLLIILLSFISTTLYATDRGIGRAETTENQRIALVIGNSNYPNNPLRNPVNDAKVVHRKLKALGFRVNTLLDADQRRMERGFVDFGKRLQSGGIGLFYYAGHGLQIDGENYLMPVDSNLSIVEDVRYDGVALGRMLGQMREAGNSMNIVLLDACRNNPFESSFRSSSQGWAQVTAPSGTFISFATAPGSVAADGGGKNGLYTANLIKHMDTPGLPIEEMFKRVRTDVQRESQGKQVPWDSSSLIGHFSFLSMKAPTGKQDSPKLIDRDKETVDESAWKLVKDSDEREELLIFIKNFPASRFRQVAEMKIELLQRKQDETIEQVPHEIAPPQEITAKSHVKLEEITQAFDKSFEANNKDAYLHFINHYQNVDLARWHISRARRLLHALAKLNSEQIFRDYQTAVQANNQFSYQAFIRKYTESDTVYLDMAQEKILELSRTHGEMRSISIHADYQTAVQSNSLVSLEAFIHKHAYSRQANVYLQMARKKMEELQTASNP